MAATFFSGFKDEQTALAFLLEQIYEGFQMQSSICVILKDEKHCNDFKKAQQQKYFENGKIEYLHDANIYLLDSKPADSFDEIHILSDKVLELPTSACENVYVYTTKADEDITKASRELYANLKKNNFDLSHEAV